MRINVGRARAGYFVGLALALSLQALAADRVQPLNVKVGLWEVTTTATTGGDIPIPAGLLEKLSPEQRARVEERMQARFSGPPRVTTRNYCLTNEQLDKGVTFDEDRKSCTSTVVASSINKLEVRIECDQRGLKSDGTLQVVALDPANVKGSVHFVVTEGDRKMNPHSTFTAKWIGATCSPK